MADNRKPGKQESRATTIIRLAGRDIDGSLNVERALSHVKGISFTMAHAMNYNIEKNLKVDSTIQISSLNEEQIAYIDNLIKNPAENGIPSFMLNMRKYMETGRDTHFVGNDLIFATRQEITRDVALRTFRGMRHQYGQKVRGQHTRSTGRTGATVGVMKKAAKAAAAPQKEEAKK